MAVVKHLEHCPAGHLVKMNFAGKARFALLGKAGNAFHPAYALFENRCEIFNLANDWGVAPEYDGAVVLDFGSKFLIKPLFDDCEIDKGVLFETAGALVRTETADFLIGAGAGLRDQVYLNFKTGDSSGRRGGARVAFSAWEIYLPDDSNKPVFKIAVRVADHGIAQAKVT
jgi:hypothetical protein